jgi:hypothetical protein
MSKSIASAFAALVLVVGLARAQDAPPADFLKHVKVGQRYTFTWNMGENTHEEQWHVATVGDDHTVTYVLTTRLKQGAKTLIETVEPTPQTWSWGGRPVLEPAAQQMAKMKQERRTFECPGLKLECVVTVMDGNLESWTAVKGDLETFPGLLKMTAKEGQLRTLVKVEEGAPPVIPQRTEQEAVEAGSNLPKGALDHVKKGQRWVFRIENSGMNAELVWTVTDVVAAEGRVVYSAKTVVTAEGTTISADESEGNEWTAGGMPVMDPNTKVEGMTGERKKLEVPGIKLDCYVLTTRMTDVHTEVWTAVKGDHEVFPGPVKQVIGPGMSQTLVRVE